MDAVKFIEERKRLCETNVSCVGCPANDSRCRFSFTDGDEAAEQVELVERWSAAHPRKTRQSEFLKEWPDTYLDGYGVVAIAPCLISKEHQGINCDASDCADCRKAFWSQEV